MRALVTGSSGFLGSLLVPELRRRGYDCLAVDVQDGDLVSGDGVDVAKLDVRDLTALTTFVGDRSVDVVFHLASQIDFAVESQAALFDNNVAATRAVADLARTRGIPKVIFTSSNSVYLGNRRDRPIIEADPPVSVDAYGRSKIEGERVLATYASDFDTVVFRCPNIMSSGRLGMLSIIFDFVREGRKCWVLGSGSARYQCIYADDLFEAFFLAINHSGSHTFNIGSDNVPTIREMYQRLVDHAGTGARVASIPSVAVPAMRLAHRLGVSPVGEYQFRMLTEDFIFDTSKLQRVLGWAPTVDNGAMLTKAYDFYLEHREAIVASSTLSANRSAVTDLGLVRLLKLIS